MKAENFNRIGLGAGFHAPSFHMYYHNDEAENSVDITEEANVFFAPVASQLKTGDLIMVVFKDIYMCFSFNGKEVIRLDS